MALRLVEQAQEVFTQETADGVDLRVGNRAVC